MASKTIQIDYYQVMYQEYDENNNLVRDNVFSIKPILEIAQSTPTKKRVIPYRGDFARLQIVKPNDSLADLWELQFVRITKDYTTGIATDDGEFKPIELDDDAGLGNSISALYDDEICVIVMQRNRDGLQPSGVLDYFSEVAQNHNITLKPIVLEEGMAKLRRLGNESIYRRIVISFADLRRETRINSKVRSLLQIIDSAKQYDAINVEITFSVGKSSRSKSLSPELSKETLSDLIESANVNKLLLYARENIDSNIEKIDLLENRLRDTINISYERGEDPNVIHEKIMDGIMQSYKKLRPRLLEKLRRC